jgi:hypothetical protein
MPCLKRPRNESERQIVASNGAHGDVLDAFNAARVTGNVIDKNILHGGSKESQQVRTAKVDQRDHHGT